MIRVLALQGMHHHRLAFLADWSRMVVAVGAACALIAGAAAAESVSPTATRIVPLWPEGSPNNPAESPRPTMEIFLPFSPEHAIPATIVICPGGGYAGRSPYERLFGEYFRGLGYTAVVVNYRLAPHRHRRSLPMPRAQSVWCGVAGRSGKFPAGTSP